MHKRYSEEIKKSAINKYKGGVTAKTVCKEYGIARSRLFLWVKQYTENKSGQIPREQYLLKKELEKLRIENRIPRECSCGVNSALDARIREIQRLQDSFSIHSLCRVLNVNRATFYNRKYRSKGKTVYEIEDDSLKLKITEISERSHHRFGARKIRAKLMLEGYVVSERRIHRLMKELGISSVGRHPKVNSANDRLYKYYPNKLKRCFLTDMPNKIWVSDITYAKVGDGIMYLCIILDLYSRKVVGYGISDNLESEFVIEVFLKSFELRNRPQGLLFHSDQGVQYTSYKFRKMLKKFGVSQSFSAPGAPHDNAVAESFFASFKREDLRRNFYTTEREFCDAVHWYIDYYNDYRPHQRLGYQTPNQVEDEYYAAKAMSMNTRSESDECL